MRAEALANPGIALGVYPERRAAPDSALDAVVRRIAGGVVRMAPLEQRDHRRFVARVTAHQQALRAMPEPALRAAVVTLRARLSWEGFAETAMAEAFALVREMTARRLGVAHYDTQLIAGRIMLGNRLAEMATGEGKTLAAALTAATAALAGIPVHVITANDYLVGRDAETLGPVYQALGLTVGAVTQPMDQAQRRAAYGCDITYCTAKELVFDYLRDSIVRRRLASDLHQRLHQLDGGAAQGPQLLLRGLCMALVDEADSILIDEARTPLIISQPRVNAQQQQYHREALVLAASMVESIDFTLDASTCGAQLTEAGRSKLAQRAASIGGLWNDRRHRDEVVSQALAAHYLLLRDRHYLVRDGKVVMIDQTTGRVAPGRVWSRGLHQLLEVKEGCLPSGEMETIAQITYQRFFPRYLRLCGMSGTLAEAAPELASVYRVGVERVPLRRPSRRRTLPLRMYRQRDAKWGAVVERVAQLRAAGRPVLIGTDSVADSEELSRRLTAARLPHAVLNARNDREEAAVVARAGQAGQVTVATNMAGRGTDIPLAKGVAERGGLHVICCQHNASHRIDRQLQGRCARQGDPGSVETILSLEDTLISSRLPRWVRALAAGVAGRDGLLPALLARLLAWWPQQAEERGQRAERRRLFERDEQGERRLSFAGRGE